MWNFTSKSTMIICVSSTMHLNELTSTMLMMKSLAETDGHLLFAQFWAEKQLSLLSRDFFALSNGSQILEQRYCLTQRKNWPCYEKGMTMAEFNYSIILISQTNKSPDPQDMRIRIDVQWASVPASLSLNLASTKRHLMASYHAQIWTAPPHHKG